jgi:hypothetical protein
MTTYPTLRTIHLLCGVFALPALAMYGISAVQMAHSRWFQLKPVVTISNLSMPTRYSDGRQLAREVMTARNLHGEINSIRQTASGFDVRITVPGTVHEIQYNASKGAVELKSSVSGTIGMLNRLHHAAGFHHDYIPLQLWGILSLIVSLAIVGLGFTGIWMWWLRKQERTWGMALITANVIFAIGLLLTLRSAGP